MTDIENSGGTAADPTGGYQTIDLNNGNGAQPYYSQWDKGGNDVWDVYERAKWLSYRSAAIMIMKLVLCQNKKYLHGEHLSHILLVLVLSLLGNK